ncbi:hypothetical protein OPV22_006102 [Ensete ventricosum]|uniref:Uncharacterized protein n=1 Tax=Ensete ventricosum TaxID=4639 RepID=A0AAV8RQX3_ENSVE|nr:hypothetical protein OPV22_006102 [Ensete ventricosum]
MDPVSRPCRVIPLFLLSSVLLNPGSLVLLCHCFDRPSFLPLPTCSKSVTLQLPSKKTYAANNVNSAAGLRVQSKKRKPRTSSKKEAPLSTLITAGVRQPNDEPKKPIQKANALSETECECEEEEDEEQEKGSLYSLSPPSSSLPLPSFALTRFKSVCSK